MVLGALHHVTCVCSDAQATTDFYRDELGFHTEEGMDSVHDGAANARVHAHEHLGSF